VRGRNHEQGSSEARSQRTPIIANHEPQSVIQSALEFTRPGEPSQETLPLLEGYSGGQVVLLAL
jgi:hypothetical protein